MEYCRYVSDSIGVCRLSERKCKASRAAVFNEPRRSATQWDSVPDSATVVYCIMLDIWSFAIQTRLAQQHIHKEPAENLCHWQLQCEQGTGVQHPPVAALPHLELVLTSRLLILHSCACESLPSCTHVKLDCQLMLTSILIRLVMTAHIQQIALQVVPGHLRTAERACRPAGEWDIQDRRRVDMAL